MNASEFRVASSTSSIGARGQQCRAAVQCDAFPEDLRTWIDEIVLVSMALEAAHSASERTDDARPGEPRIPAGHARILLTILAYSYATGVYASEEVADRIASDPQLRYLSAGARPTRDELRRFRRQNREFLREAIREILRLAWQFRLWSSPRTNRLDLQWRGSIGLGPCEECRPVNLIDQAADDRLNQAILRDSLALDD